MSHPKPSTPDQIGDSSEILRALRGEYIEPKGKPKYNLELVLEVDREELLSNLDEKMNDGIMMDGLERYVKQYRNMGWLLGAKFTLGKGKFNITDDGYIIPGYENGLPEEKGRICIDRKAISSIEAMIFAMEKGLGSNDSSTTLQVEN